MKQFNMNRAINHRQYVIYWYKSNKVRLNIQKYINLLKKIVCTPYIFAAPRETLTEPPRGAGWVILTGGVERNVIAE